MGDPICLSVGWEGDVRERIRRGMEKKTCLDCSAYLPASGKEPTEFGICLKDEAFEPFIEELLEDLNFTSCRDLIEEKKFVGEDRRACPDFEELERIEIDDNSPFGKELRRLADSGELTPDTLESALFEEQVRRIDWKTVPVDDYVRRLQSRDPKDRKSAISGLGALIASGNSAALQALIEFLRSLPPPATINEVHFRKEILWHLSCTSDRATVAPCLIDDLYRTPSNNTTKQWISDILRFLKSCPLDVIEEPLEGMLSDKRFSYRLKKKIREMLYGEEAIWPDEI